MRQRRLLEKASPCENNLYDGGPQTIAEAQREGSCICPNYETCASGVLNPETGIQCVDLFAIQVARFVAAKERRGGNVDAEMRELTKQLPAAPKGWFTSKNRESFTTITDRAQVLRDVEERARNMLYGPEGRTDPRLNVGGDFASVQAYSTTGDGIVDLRRMDELEGRFGSNGGRGCDVNSGPCSCGAWH